MEMENEQRKIKEDEKKIICFPENILLLNELFILIDIFTSYRSISVINYTYFL